MPLGHLCVFGEMSSAHFLVGLFVFLFVVVVIKLYELVVYFGS